MQKLDVAGSIQQKQLALPPLIGSYNTTDTDNAFFFDVVGKYAYIIMSDGEGTENDTLTAVKEAKNDKIRIFCAGIGSGRGSTIPYIDNTGKAVLLKDKDGNIVRSKLDEKMLKEIAAETDGFYVRADTLPRSPLGLIYEKYLSKLKNREQQELLTKSHKERFQFPVGLALLVLIIEIALSMAG